MDTHKNLFLIRAYVYSFYILDGSNSNQPIVTDHNIFRPILPDEFSQFMSLKCWPTRKRSLLSPSEKILRKNLAICKRILLDLYVFIHSYKCNFLPPAIEVYVKYIEILEYSECVSEDKFVQ